MRKHRTGRPDADIYVTLTRQHEDYHACVPSDMEHDDWVAENMDDVSVEVFSVIELDMSNRSDSTESCWLTWDQLEATQAWDYTPLCMSLVARVSSDVVEGTNEKWQHEHLHNLAQLGEFISAVYYRNHAFIDVDDYVMHAFRIPKPKTLTAMTRYEKLTNYIDNVIEGMDFKDMYRYIFDTMLYDF